MMCPLCGDAGTCHACCDAPPPRRTAWGRPAGEAAMRQREIGVDIVHQWWCGRRAGLETCHCTEGWKAAARLRLDIQLADGR